MHIYNSYLIKVILTALSAQLVKGYLLLEHDNANKAVSSLCFFSTRLSEEIRKSQELLILHKIEAHTIVVALNDYYKGVVKISTTTPPKEIDKLTSVTNLIHQLVDYQNKVIVDPRRINNHTHSDVIDKIYPIYNEHLTSKFPQERANYFGT